ncbi:MAG: cellulase family glycosylhydrolase [Hyphomicrobiaceae bacterium]
MAWCSALAGCILLVTTGVHGKDSQSKWAAKCRDMVMHNVPTKRLQMLTNGINVSRWFNAKPDEAREIPSDATLKRLRVDGFSHIRLPVAAERLLKPFGNPDRADAMLNELKDAIDRLVRFGFVVSIDLHPGARFRAVHKSTNSVPYRAGNYLVDIWAKLARKLKKTSPDEVLFELLNEPAVDQVTWHRQAGELIKTIRAIAPLHTLIYGTANQQQVYMLKGLKPFKDRNVVYAVHFYDPFVFTHQGVHWIQDAEWLKKIHDLPFPMTSADGRPFDETSRQGIRLKASLDRMGPEAAAKVKHSMREGAHNAARINTSFSKLALWADKCQRPVIVNEFGAFRRNVSAKKLAVLSVAERAAFDAREKSSRQSRKNWLRAVRAAADKHRIGLARWELTKGFGLQN